MNFVRFRQALQTFPISKFKVPIVVGNQSRGLLVSNVFTTDNRGDRVFFGGQL